MLQGRRPEAAIRPARYPAELELRLLPARHLMNKIGMSKPSASHKIIFDDDSGCLVDSYDRTSITTLCAVGSEAKVSKALP
jgi:hypothetical protein